MRKNSITDFVEEQEILNNIQTSIKKLYEGDEALNSEEFLAELTVKTLEVINYMDQVHLDLLEEPGIIETAENCNASTHDIAKDIVEIMLFSTIARQAILLEEYGAFE